MAEKIKASLERVWFFWNFLKKKKKVVLAVIFGALALVVVAYVIYDFYFKERIPAHNCFADIFYINLRRGEETSFSVNLSPSRKSSDFRVRLGNLPKGISGGAESFGKKEDKKARVSLLASEETLPASYSLVIVYEEDQEWGRGFLKNYCQFNLIVE